MTFATAFYLYILPGAICVVGLGWMLFDRWRERRRTHLHPGE
ncbi:hypothetical protein SAMN05880590_10581 [Rhizobium sp. RU35A]|nr:hypothetical protein SAMN05880590_10581 [Rhizobium sp. RU35A]